jgi:hypothetical protein
MGSNPTHIFYMPAYFGGMYIDQSGQVQRAPTVTPTTMTRYSAPAASAGATGAGGVVRNPDGSYSQPNAGYTPRPPSSSTAVNWSPSTDIIAARTGSNLGDATGLLNRPPTPRAPGTYVLQDSNPRPQPRPLNSPASSSSSQSGYRDLIGAPGGMGGSGGNASGASQGSILGSSVSQPPFYGAGLAPASGLGGGLYPSLVSLYK